MDPTWKRNLAIVVSVAVAVVAFTEITGIELKGRWQSANESRERAREAEQRQEELVRRGIERSQENLEQMSTPGSSTSGPGSEPLEIPSYDPNSKACRQKKKYSTPSPGESSDETIERMKKSMELSAECYGTP